MNGSGSSFVRRSLRSSSGAGFPSGRFITLIFENRETLRFQTQEMIRVEHILDPHKIQDELDVYNALMPGGR